MAAGAGFGLTEAVILSRFLERLLFEVRPIDLGGYAVTTTTLIAVALLAAWLGAFTF